jgi:peptide/nickel transport system substrate-binding protein
MPTVSTDGLVYTIPLREDVKFHDGTDFDANAVWFSWNTSWSGQWYTISNQALAQISTVEVVDNYTLRIILKNAFGPFSSMLSMPPLCIYSPQHYDRDKDEYIGTGPWKFESWFREEELTLVPNKDYYRPEEIPKLNKLVWKFYKSSTALSFALKEKRVDIAWRTPPASDVAAFQADPNYEVIAEPPARLFGFYGNIRYEPFDDVRVRQAMAMAINRTEIINTVYQGVLAHEIFSIMPDSFLGYKPSFEEIDPMNLTRARELLDEAGFPDGISSEIWIAPAQWGDIEQDLAVLVKNQLAQIGINVEIKVGEYAFLLAETKAGRLPMFMFHWLYDYYDGFQYLHNFMWGGSNPFWAGRIGYNDTHANDLILEAQATPDWDERELIYYEIQDYAAQTVPIVPIGTQYQHAIVSKNVLGFRISSPFFATVFTNVTKSSA